jgi:tetratricopeptide (TPR) repeat protein
MGFFSNLFSTKQSTVDPTEAYKLEKMEKAAQLFNDGNWQELLDFSKKWAEEYPDNSFAFQSIGDALVELGKAKEAVSQYRKGLELIQQNPTSSYELELAASGIWYRLGNTYVKLGDKQKAVEAFVESTRLDPDEAQTWNSLAVAYCNVTKPQEAIKAFEKAIELEPENTLYLSNLGIYYADAGNKQEVNAIHEKLTQIDPEAAEVFKKKAGKFVMPLFRPKANNK